MNKPIVIAVDAMGGDNSPKKIIDGIELYFQKNKRGNLLVKYPSHYLKKVQRFLQLLNKSVKKF